MRMKDKVALISGAASGMGAATARLFGREGAAVVFVAALVSAETLTVGNATVASAPLALTLTVQVFAVTAPVKVIVPSDA